ncbi:MAG: hypothetical protein ABIQ72_05720 [Usitatibacter sp.]
MKFENRELALVQEVAEKNDVAVIELSEAQFALVGGGGGEVIFH